MEFKCGRVEAQVIQCGWSMKLWLPPPPFSLRLLASLEFLVCRNGTCIGLLAIFCGGIFDLPE